jgi:hypothetical protein
MRQFALFDPSDGTVKHYCQCAVPPEHDGLAVAEFANVSYFDATRGRYRVDLASLDPHERDVPFAKLVAEIA